MGAENPVLLPWNSNMWIKPTGNQTFQYPCSCRIYAIKHSLRRPALHPYIPFFHHLSLSLISPSLSPCHRTPQMFMRACRYMFIHAYMHAYTGLCTHIFAWVADVAWRVGGPQGKGPCPRECPPLNLIQFNIIDVQCRAIWPLDNRSRRLRHVTERRCFRWRVLMGTNKLEANSYRRTDDTIRL